MNRPGTAALILAVATAASAPMITMTPRPALAQADASRCSVHTSGSSTDVAVSFSAAVDGVGPGAGPRVLGRVDVSSSGGSTPSATFHAITTRGAGANDRAVAVPATVCSSSSSRVPLRQSSCSVSGEASSRTILIGLLLPAVQRARDGSTGAAPESYDVVLSPRGDASAGTVVASCDAPASRRGEPRASWDIKTIKR